MAPCGGTLFQQCFISHQPLVREAINSAKTPNGKNLSNLSGHSRMAGMRRASVHKLENLNCHQVSDEQCILDFAGLGHHPAIVQRRLLCAPTDGIGVIMVVRLLYRRGRCLSKAICSCPTVAESRPRVRGALHIQFKA